jgi:ABC-type phosphate/phosphonate transport system substrate-binding protein
MGWVSRRSVTGFLLPRLYLESFGVDVDSMFGTQRFLGSHEAALEALASDSVDVIATDSRRVGSILGRTRGRVLASMGPLPSDLLVAGYAVPPGIRDALIRGMIGLSVAGITFARARAGHLDVFERIGRGASTESREAPGASSATLLA